MSEKTQKKQSKRRETGCPVAFSLDVFGDRWTLLIIREMMIAGKNTYSDFLEAEEAIATNILIDRLKLLEAEGIVKKERDPENRRSFLYHLTREGRRFGAHIGGNDHLGGKIRPARLSRKRKWLSWQTPIKQVLKKSCVIRHRLRVELPR